MANDKMAKTETQVDLAKVQEAIAYLDGEEFSVFDFPEVSVPSGGSTTWTVPTSITRNEILPKMARDPGYLRKNNMEIVGGTAALPVIRQRPGASNALGRVKFIFPNSYSIYMHDTPSQGAFALEKRAFSHGCIRLSQPRELAEYLLRDDPDWTAERIRQAMYGGRETTVLLNKKRPVRIGYFTAWVDGEGQLNFRDDVYGHDQRLARELFLATDSAGAIAR